MASTDAVFWNPTTPTATAGGIVHGDGSKYSITAVGLAGQVIQSNGSSSPTWGFQSVYTTKLATSVTGTQNNYAPGVSGNTIEYWSGASDVTITGLAGGVTNQIYTFKNIGTHNAFFSQLSGSSSAGNQFSNILIGGATPVAPQGIVSYVYDGTNWKLLDHIQGGLISFSATWTSQNNPQPALGNGTLTANYIVTGPRVFMQATLTIGTTSTLGTGAWGITIPTVVQSIGISDIGNAQDADVGNNPTFSAFDFNTTSASAFIIATGVAVDSTHPFAWAATDSWTLNFDYI